ncbi:MAG: ubiquinol-cytochrome c reductase iron-sulfur subunit [Gammaproteobacteria bacterium]
MSDRGNSLVSEDEVDVERRRFLITTTAGVGTVGAIAAAVPFVSSFQPSERAKAVGAPIEIDISKLEPGQRVIEKWRGKPVWVVRRSKETLEALKGMSDLLADPDSVDIGQQPEYAQNASRASNSEYLVVLGICTHLGCSPTYLPEGTPHTLGPDWQGGFFCPCHGSKFDLAGRVYKSVPAPKNLLVPPYQFLSETLLLVGQDGVKS